MPGKENEEMKQMMMQIIKSRINAMPPNIRLAVLGEVLSKEDILKAIEEGTPLGQRILRMEQDYYVDLISRW